MNTTVMFGIPGMNTANGQAFEQPAAAADAQPLTPALSQSGLMSVVLMLVLLIGGYMGLRWIMED